MSEWGFATAVEILLPWAKLTRKEELWRGSTCESLQQGMNLLFRGRKKGVP